MISQRNSIWRLAHGREIELGAIGHVMAIVNVTPDSFSDGGRYAQVGSAVDRALACAAEGASIVDVGGESTRPGAVEVTAAEEQDRILPVIERLAAGSDMLISVDTYRAETARLAIEAGAHIINDVHGLRFDPQMANVAAETGAGVCIMHTGRGRNDLLADVITDQLFFLRQSLELASAAGVADDRITLDPGFGFAKDREHDVELMARFGELHELGFPLVVGTSRKRFVGALAGRDLAADRDAATAATTVVLRLAGAQIFRVHDVSSNLDALRVADAMLQIRDRMVEAGRGR